MRLVIRYCVVMLFAGLAASAQASERVALVMGLSGYQNIPTLTNPLNDARDLATTLEDIGFDVTLALDSTNVEMRDLLDGFAFRSETADLALIYFAGHGVEVQGENFLLPVDAAPESNRDVQKQSVSLTDMLASVERARKMRIVILDSCRDNPLGGNIDVISNQASSAIGQSEDTRGGGGLAPADPERGTLVAFAARDGQVALDGKGENSPYARALMEKMAEPGLEISLMFRQIRDAVLKETNNLQEPHTYGSLSGTPFYMSGPPAGAGAPGGDDPTTSWANMRPDQEKQYLALADLGDTRSMIGLAHVRLNPNDPRHDPATAVEFLERAAEAGSAEAKFELARQYESNAGGVPADLMRAVQLYHEAADDGYADAINDLGFYYFQGGIGIKRDAKKALEHFERAAELRHPEALFNYAVLIDDGLVSGKGAAESGSYLYAALRTGNRQVLRELTERPNAFSSAARKALQEQLRAFGFYSGAIDGSFGPSTKQAVRAAFGL